MNNYLQIRDTQTSITPDYARKVFNEGAVGIHESVLRSYQILQKVRVLLADGVPPHVVLELIDLMDSHKPD